MLPGVIEINDLEGARKVMSGMFQIHSAPSPTTTLYSARFQPRAPASA